MEIRFELREESLRRQRVFRKLLNAMAFPGSVQELEGGCLNSLLDTLLDRWVSFWCDESLVSLCLQTGAVPSSLEDADFVISSYSLVGKIERLKRGKPEYPDRSATVIRLVESLDEGMSVRLRGPGIKDYAFIRVKGMQVEEFLELSKVNSFFPLGVDLILLDRDCRLCAVPRSVKLEVF